MNPRTAHRAYFERFEQARNRCLDENAGPP
jgi:hypothetical protein